MTIICTGLEYGLNKKLNKKYYYKLNADASSDLQFLLTYEGKAGKGPFPSSST
jgi:hypothetical protein